MKQDNRSKTRTNKQHVSGKAAAKQRPSSEYEREFMRSATEDDDGYDPYSDRRPRPEPLFERDPWS